MTVEPSITSVECSGTPYQIGFAHGQATSAAIERSIEFYGNIFSEKVHLKWDEVHDLAQELGANILEKWPRYYEEMQGVADGAQRPLLDIVALNVRSEVVFGRYSDGCTSLYCESQTGSFMGQNWDWMPEQAPNLVHLTIDQPGFPKIQMITEAGIIGKIGMNSSGVGVCLNAIRIGGISHTRIPLHLGLRMVLESTSAEAAVKTITDIGVASAGYYLIGDGTTGLGLEFTNKTMVQVPASDNILPHSNHFVESHPGIKEDPWLADSPVRIKTIRNNASIVARELSLNTFGTLFEDETQYPCSISRAAEGESDFATLFNIAMDLRQRMARVRIGRPKHGQPSTELLLKFES